MLVEHIKARPRVTRPWLFRLDPFWALFGNADDGLFGDDRWRAGRPKTLRLALEWWARNPFHNFCFYVVGVTEHDHVFLSTKPWGEQPGWSFHAVLTPTLRIPLPMVAYVGKRRGWYIGWRPYGSFGISLNFAKR